MTGIRISKTDHSNGKNSKTDRIQVYIDMEPTDGRPYYKGRWVCEETDHVYETYWVFNDEIHSWFAENRIPYTIDYEIDWWVDVAEEHAVMVKLALGQ